MAGKDKYDLSVSIKGEEIFFELSTLNPGNASSDDKLGLDTMRVEMTIAKIFHKLINYLNVEKDLFEKEDFKLLGEILGKIIFSRKIGQMVVNFLFPKEKNPPECLRIYLEINDNSQLAELPWEYIQVWPGEKIASLGEQNVYLSANEKSRFQLMRRLNKQPVPVCTTQQLNVVLVICNNTNRAEGITGRSSESIVKVFGDLKNKYPGYFDFQLLENPEKENFTSEIVNALKKFKREDHSIPAYCIHYFGHSRLMNGEGQLVFKTKTLEATWIKDEEFAGFFNKALLALKCNEQNENGNDLLIDAPSVVLFQSCDSGKIGDLSKGKGVAVAMAKKDIPAVIGMQNEIDPESSSAFSNEYYRSLIEGCDVAEAVTNGRYFLGYKYNIQTAKDIFGTNEFGSPVLFINTIGPITLVKQKVAEQIGNNTAIDPDKKKCLNCNAENELNAKFCSSCGQPFRDQKVGRNMEESSTSARKQSFSGIAKDKIGSEANKQPVTPTTDITNPNENSNRGSESAGTL